MFDVYQLTDPMRVEDALVLARQGAPTSTLHFTPTTDLLDQPGYRWVKEEVFAEHYFDQLGFPFARNHTWLSHRLFYGTQDPIDYDDFKEAWSFCDADWADYRLVHRTVGTQLAMEKRMQATGNGRIQDANVWYLSSFVNRFRLWKEDAPMCVFVDICSTGSDDVPDMAIGHALVEIDMPPFIRACYLSPPEPMIQLARLAAAGDKDVLAIDVLSFIAGMDIPKTDAFINAFIDTHRVIAPVDSDDIATEHALNCLHDDENAA